MRADRLRRVRTAMAAQRCDLLALPPGDDFLYLAGFAPLRDERACVLLVGAGGEALLVPRVNAAQVESRLPVRLFTYNDTQGPFAALEAALRSVGDRLEAVAVGDDMRADHLLLMQQALPGARFLPASRLLAPMRMRKDPAEIEALRRAAATADAGVLAAAEACRPGTSEREVAAAAAGAIRGAGADAVGFAIVASGPNSAFPHHEPTNRRLRVGEAVLLDVGGRRDGYCSDITRMVFLGEPTPKYREVHALVEEAVRAALGVIRPDVPVAEVDRAARGVIARAGYGEFFIHRTGHGLGLTAHEPPSVVDTDATRLQEGMVFSVEPGIYLPGEFGVRLEDIVVVTQHGPEILSRLPRGLLRSA
ncbi:MAG: Xaa-Pro peptidase family protein [Armatimonadota bacterium]|nr:Xaa-Pro peptidase family protein [Armatimonadota bacterium]MDR5696786.1 Xaa-Pro peptidase family protein [Armatimonadota bacterium]